MSKSRILILTGSFLPTVGGLQYELKWFLDNLDRWLNDQDDLEFHFVYPNSASEIYSRFDNISTHDLQIGYFGKYSMPTGIARLGRLLRKIRPDVVHCHALLPDGLWITLASVIFRVRTKLVVTSHGQDIVWLPQWSYGMRASRQSRILAGYVARRLSAHVLPSRAITKYAVDAGTAENRIVIIPNGVPIDFDCDFEEHADGGTSHMIPDISVSDPSAGLNFLSLSSTRDIKNLDMLIESFALAKPDLGDSKMFLTSQGRDAARIADLVHRVGLAEDVHLLGEVTGLAKHTLFRAADIYCLVSHFENFPVTLLEAMKFSTAIIASEVGGIPEFVRHGHNGLLVSPTDAEGIASSMIKLYSDADLRNRLINNGLAVVPEYSISKSVNNHIALYKRVALQNQ